MKLMKNNISKKVDEWIQEQKYQEYSNNTLKQYKTNVMKFVNWIPEDVEISKELTMEYKKYLYELNPKPSTRSINVWIIELNKFLKWLGYGNATLEKFKIQQKNSNEEIITIADYKRLLRFSKRQNKMDLYYIMKILIMTGIRISELKYFTYESLNSNYIKVYNKGKERTIIIRQDLTRELRKYCRENKIKSGYIFRNIKTGKLINASTIWRQMQRVAGAARVNKKKVHAHSFRHLFAQVFLNEFSGNITELADILGHNSLETTRLYTRSSDSQKKTKLEMLSFK